MKQGIGLRKDRIFRKPRRFTTNKRCWGVWFVSNYNSRPRPPEVLIEKDGTARLIRTRESVADMLVMELNALGMREKIVVK